MPDISSYAEQLKCPRTLHHKVIEEVDEYTYRPLFGGVISALLPVPQATADRCVIILDTMHISPTVLEILESPTQTYNLRTQHVGKVLFAYVGRRMKQITVTAPDEGYQLNDGKTIFVDVDLYIQIHSVRAFWQAAADPMAQLEINVRQQIQQYFFTESSTTLVTVPGSNHQGAGRGLYEIQFTRVRNNLIQQLSTLSVPGITINQIEVRVGLNDMLNAWIDRQYQKIWGEKGIFDRLFVDLQINDDTTFPDPFLRGVLMRMDRRLLENFYRMPFGEAMQKVHERMAELKMAYYTKCKQEIEMLQQYLQIATDRKLDEMRIESLRETLATRLQACADDTMANAFRTDEQFFDDVF